MAAEIKVPSLGESVTEATVAKWLKRPGEAVNVDEPVAELETDKITLEVYAPVTGTLAEILAEEGANMPVGAVLGRIAEGAAVSPNPPIAAARLGFMSIFVKAAIVALKELPAVNAEIDGDDIVYKNHYDIGVAVATEQGLVVPVVRDPDRMSFAEIEQAIAALARKARDGKLTIEDLSGGTFTITNGGVYGSLMSTPILNPPQSGILGMHKIARRPIAVGDKVEIRPMMYVALSYDHRIVDGREAVTFLVRIKECVEEPSRILFDV